VVTGVSSAEECCLGNGFWLRDPNLGGCVQCIGELLRLLCVFCVCCYIYIYLCIHTYHVCNNYVTYIVAM